MRASHKKKGTTESTLAPQQNIGPELSTMELSEFHQLVKSTKHDVIIKMNNVRNELARQEYNPKQQHLNKSNTQEVSATKLSHIELQSLSHVVLVKPRRRGVSHFRKISRLAALTTHPTTANASSNKSNQQDCPDNVREDCSDAYAEVFDSTPLHASSQTVNQEGKNHSGKKKEKTNTKHKNIKKKNAQKLKLAVQTTEELGIIDFDDSDPEIDDAPILPDDLDQIMALDNEDGFEELLSV